MKNLPNIDLYYWALILSANIMGETAGDLISQTFDLGYAGATIVLLVLFISTLIFSIYSITQKPFLYWTIITLASTTGTTIADSISRTFFNIQLGFTENQGYTFSVYILIILLTSTFLFWKKYSPKSSIDKGLTKFTEFLYWFAILISSTLGTSFGDWLAHNTPLGFDGGTILLSSLLGIVILIYFTRKVSIVILYWFAIILTHPIGATMGDYMTKPEGLNLGNSNASLILLVVFAFVILLGRFASQKSSLLS